MTWRRTAISVEGHGDGGDSGVHFNSCGKRLLPPGLRGLCDGTCHSPPHGPRAPDILCQASGWKTSSQLTFVCPVLSPQRRVLVTPFRWDVSDVHLSNCAESEGATGNYGHCDMLAGYKGMLWGHSSGFETWSCPFLAV